VIIHARRIVIALRDGDPIDVAAPPSRRIALRIAPQESPPASLHEEVDDVPGDNYISPLTTTASPRRA
jgi:hypothetical protein